MIFRCSSGLSEMNRRAVLYVLPPVNPFTVSTAGSAATILIIGSMILSMAWNEVSWSAVNRSLNPSGILLREKSLGHANEQVNVQARCVASKTSSVIARKRSATASVLPYRFTTHSKARSLVRYIQP